MSNLIKPQTIDGIEFYVSSDGTQTGVSIAGLARLCGVSYGTMHKTLLNLQKPAIAYEPPKSLEPLLGEVFHLSLEGEKGATIVKDSAAARIVRYYAYDSKAANTTAQFSLDKFLEKGFNTWVKEVVGYNESGDIVGLMSTMQEVLGELKELRIETKEYKSIKKTSETTMPGLDALMKELAYPDKTLAPGEKKVNLAEWLQESKGIVDMEKSAKFRFAYLVSATYKSITKRDPSFENRPTRTMVFAPIEFPILQIAFNKLMANG